MQCIRYIDTPQRTRIHVKQFRTYEKFLKVGIFKYRFFKRAPYLFIAEMITQ